MLHFIDRSPEAQHLKVRVAELMALAESCSRQIRTWADSLQNTDIKGPRHLTEQSRAEYDRPKRAVNLRERLAQTLHEAHPDLYPSPKPDTQEEIWDLRCQMSNVHRKLRRAK